MTTSNKLIEIQNYIIQRLQHNEFGVNLLEAGWKPSFNKRLTRAIGRCHYSKKLIEISLHFAPTLTEKEWKDVVNHEIAHALTPRAGHGPEWKRAAIILGADPSPKKTLEEQPKGKYVVAILNKNGQYEAIQYRNRKRQLKNAYVPGRKEETLGKMFLVTYEEFEKLNKD